jgi:monoamine oxidase
VTQKIKLRAEEGQKYPPYLNAGPGRIPSGHRHVLDLCKALKVDLEVYIMESRSNLVYATQGRLKNKSLINRRVANDVRGHIAADLYNRLPKPDDSMTAEERLALKKYSDLLISFGALVATGVNKGKYKGSSRSGYKTLPGLGAGEPAEPIPMSDLVESEFWLTNFYQPEEFLWQTSSFQPVGGMDKIEKALEAKILALGGKIHLGAQVTQIRRSREGFTVAYRVGQALEEKTVSGKFCVSNIPIPLLKGKISQGDFSEGFWKDLSTVMDNKEFLRPTCKVGWQAERRLWQDPQDPNSIPIMGGISHTPHPITQMWYPSNAMHDRYGVLTGTYNYEENADKMGRMMPPQRLALAREGALQLHGRDFAAGLTDEYGISIAWQNIPTQLGGWADWGKIAPNDPAEQARIMNKVREGERNFLIVGDQVSFLPGWKEGAVVTALEVFALISGVRNFRRLVISKVPNTAALTQGYHH